MENHHFQWEKIHYFDWAIFNSYVSSPEGIKKNLGKFSIIWIELLKMLGMNRRFFMMAMQLAELWFMVTIAIDGAIGYQK